MRNSSIKWDACSFLELEIKRLVLHCNSSFARTPLFLQLALVGCPSCNLSNSLFVVICLFCSCSPGVARVISSPSNMIYQGFLIVHSQLDHKSVLCALLLPSSSFSDSAQLITLSSVASSQLAPVFSPPSFPSYSFIASACHHKTKQNPCLFLGERGERQNKPQNVIRCWQTVSLFPAELKMFFKIVTESKLLCPGIFS